MAQWKLLGSTALVAFVSGNAVLADVTAEEVWQSWKDMGSTYGQTITTTNEARNGDALVVEDVTIAMDKDDVSIKVSVPEVTFTDLGDGTVQVTATDEYPMTITFPSKDGGQPTAIEVTLSHPDMTITASGSPDETRYDFNAPSLAATLAKIEGADADKANIAAKVALTAFMGNSIVTGTDTKALSSNFTLGSVDVDFSGTDKSEAGGTFVLKAALEDLSGTSSSKLVGDLQDMAAALKAGFASEGSMAYGKTSFDFALTETPENVSFKGGAASGNFLFKMAADGLAYGGGAKDVSISVAGAQIPFPELTVTYAESAFNLMMPIMASDASTDFALLTKLIDLKIPDDVWAMVDPTNQLPRDPLSVVLDTKGSGKLRVDIIDPKAMEAAGGKVPGELNALDLNALQIKMAGAEITGSGALTFDNSDLVTFGGLPAPTGKVELKATGANGLMDKLAAMGLIPEDQLMGARMMLGMFAKVVEGETDTMTSTLEFKDKGFFANGMQLQ